MPAQQATRTPLWWGAGGEIATDAESGCGATLARAAMPAFSAAGATPHWIVGTILPSQLTVAPDGGTGRWHMACRAWAARGVGEDRRGGGALRIGPSSG